MQIIKQKKVALHHLFLFYSFFITVCLTHRIKTNYNQEYLLAVWL